MRFFFVRRYDRCLWRVKNSYEFRNFSLLMVKFSYSCLNFLRQFFKQYISHVLMIEFRIFAYPQQLIPKPYLDSSISTYILLFQVHLKASEGDQ